MDAIRRAVALATRAHDGQRRKYTNEPYINHPKAVMALVCSVPHTEEMACAAVLHDVVEDTAVTIDAISAEFGPVVAGYVWHLTTPSEAKLVDREMRRSCVREHLDMAPAEVKTIKLADVIDNTATVAERDPRFAKSYMQEKRSLLEVLDTGNSQLFMRAKGIIDGYFSQQGGR